mmetsp:Transcript_1491/g.4017  ORF Transcript_1491/g.4017 Transcript_1491/m.4017 type:complete len:238 (-) Transcript_1491:339-1052(-)
MGVGSSDRAERGARGGHYVGEQSAFLHGWLAVFFTIGLTSSGHQHDGDRNNATGGEVRAQSRTLVNRACHIRSAGRHARSYGPESQGEHYWRHGYSQTTDHHLHRRCGVYFGEAGLEPSPWPGHLRCYWRYGANLCLAAVVKCLGRHDCHHGVLAQQLGPTSPVAPPWKREFYSPTAAVRDNRQGGLDGGLYHAFRTRSLWHGYYFLGGFLQSKAASPSPAVVRSGPRSQPYLLLCC